MPTYSPDDSKTNEDKGKSYPKGKPQTPNSHTDLLMSLMQSQQPTPSNTMGGHTGAGETHRDRKVILLIMDDAYLPFSVLLMWIF